MPRSVKTTVDAFERIDILVDNAGVNIRKAPQDYTLTEWHQVLNTNRIIVFLCCREVCSYMAQAGGGKIINRTGRNGRSSGFPHESNVGLCHRHRLARRRQLYLEMMIYSLCEAAHHGATWLGNERVV
jgi:NAD(P)-dependent dehydrogenase (short-subunit alcohol dehydrogenase family)